MADPVADPIETLDVHVTAEDAYPAFERLFLGARREVVAGFRVFDLTTRLRSPEARAVGDTWFDLFEDTLARGVDITLVVSDFDPVVATDYHRQSWETARQLAAADALADRGTLTFRIARHAARAGIIPRALLRPRVRDRFRKQTPDRNTPGLNALSEDDVFDLSPATHHQKLAVFDRTTLYIGGLDLDERRYDTKEHRRAAQETWHDVQVTVTGPVVGAALKHLDGFEAAVAARRDPPPAAPGFLRTLSARRWPAPLHISPRTLVREIEDAHLDAIAKTSGLIYLESQYLRHIPLATALARAASTAPDLRLIAVLPAAPEDVAFGPETGRDARLGEHLQARAIARILDGFGDRALFCSPAQPRRAEDPGGRDTLHQAPLIYVHSKVSIFDKDRAIVSSANLNGRSLRWDTEAGIELTRRDHVERLRDRLFAHWMPEDVMAHRHAPRELFDAWRDTVIGDIRRAPAERRGLLLPYDLAAARDLGEPVPYVPRELV